MIIYLGSEGADEQLVGLVVDVKAVRVLSGLAGSFFINLEFADQKLDHSLSPDPLEDNKLLHESLDISGPMALLDEILNNHLVHLLMGFRKGRHEGFDQGAVGLDFASQQGQAQQQDQKAFWGHGLGAGRGFGVGQLFIIVNGFIAIFIASLCVYICGFGFMVKFDKNQLEKLSLFQLQFHTISSRENTWRPFLHSAQGSKYKVEFLSLYASNYFQIKINHKKQRVTMDNESELPIQYFNFKNSDKNSDILSLHPSLSLIDLENLDKKNQIFPEHFEEGHASEMELSEVDSEKAQEYFNLLFSPKVVTQSLVRRNQYLEMKCLENSESEPEEIYHKRKQRVNNLEKKERKNWEILLDMKKSQPDRYVAFTKLMKLLGEVKTKLNGIRHDYYSEKTFLTLKKSSPEQLLSLTKILSSILISVTQNKIYSGPQDEQAQKQLSDIYLQFLIIPRFFISREKLLKFLKDEKLQQSFTFLIYNHCLGHYNNEANKKLPQEKQMQFIRQLFESEGEKEERQGQDAREKFKKICVINHGGKFIKRYGELYYQLYGRSLECLKKVDLLGKERGSREEILEEFARDRSQEQQMNIEVISVNSIQNFNLNLNFNPNPNIISFNLDPHLLYPPSSFLLQQLQNHSINSFLNSELKPTMLENKLTKTSSLFKSNMIEIHQTMVNSGTMLDGQPREKERERQEKEEGLRPKIRRINSLVDEKKEGSEEEGRVRSGFRVKRWLTMEAQRQNNIIIVHPPNKGHMDDQLI